MEKNKTIQLIVRFGTSVEILSYYGGFIDAKQLMSQLCKATKDQWSINSKAYKFGLNNKRRGVILLKNDFDFDLLEFINETKLHLYYHLSITICSDYKLYTLIENLPKLGAVEPIQIDEIIVPNEFYTKTPHLLKDLYALLDELKISKSGVSTSEPLNFTENLHVELDYAPKVILNEFGSSISSMEALVLKEEHSYYFSDDSVTSTICKYLKDFRATVNSLVIGCRIDLEEFGKSEFSSNFKQSVKTIYIEYFPEQHQDPEFDKISKLSVFENLKKIEYSGFSKMPIKFFPDIITKLKDFSFSFTLFSKVDSKNEVMFELENAVGYIKHNDGLLTFNGANIKFFNTDSEHKVFKFLSEGIQLVKEADINFIEISNVQLIKEFDLQSNPMLGKYFNEGLLWIKNSPLMNVRINQNNGKIFDILNLPTMKNLIVEFDLLDIEDVKITNMVDIVNSTIYSKVFHPEKLYIKAIIHFKHLSNKAFRELIFEVLSLPINDLEFNLSSFDPTVAQKEVLNNLYETVVANKQLKHFYTPNRYGFGDMIMRYIDHDDPSEAALFQKSVHNIIFKQKFTQVSTNPKNRLMIAIKSQ